MRQSLRLVLKVKPFKIFTAIHTIHFLICSEGRDFIIEPFFECLPEVQAYWEKHSFSLPFSAQNDDAVFSLFASHTIPRILITDKEGIIRAVYTDDPLATYQELAKDIDAVLIDKLSGNER